MTANPIPKPTKNTLQDPRLVDSKKRDLVPQEIMMIGAAVAGEADMDSKSLYAAISAELMSGHAIAIKFGNTLFIINPLPDQPEVCFFRALNADVAQNYLQNCKEFIALAQKNGYKTLVTQFKDKNLVRLLQMVKDTGGEYYAPTTKMEVLPLGEKGYQVSIFMDESQYDPNGKSADPNFNKPPRGNSPLPPAGG